MKIIITGASGFVGRGLVPRLLRDGHDLVLVGRNRAALIHAYPDLTVADYDELEQQDVAAIRPDAVLHLAAANNDAEHGSDYFKAVNVDFAVRVAHIANRVQAGCFINTTSLHAAQAGNSSHYAQSKRAGELEIAQALSVRLVNLRLPAVYGASFAGKLAVLNALPRFLRTPAFKMLALLKPAVSIDRIADAVSEVVQSGFSGEYLLTDQQESNTYYSFTKAVFDYAVGTVGLIASSWVIAICIVAIRMNSPGAAIFAQQRVGRDGKPFTCYKLRTMRVGTVQAGTHEVSASSVTGIGHFLRRTKLDELPQLWNILRGEMSFVGPRPCLPSQVELVDARRQRGVLAIKPGITGLAQVEGIDMSDPERLARRDADYLKLRTLLLDLKILVGTALGKGSGDRVS